MDPAAAENPNRIESEALAYIFKATRDIFPAKPYNEDGNPEMYTAGQPQLRAFIDFSGGMATEDELRFNDDDGDEILFKLHGGRLQQYMNGQLEIGDVQSLSYSHLDRKVRDDTGEFTLRPGESSATPYRLHVLAKKANVPWRGDEPPCPADGEAPAAAQQAGNLHSLVRFRSQSCEAPCQGLSSLSAGLAPSVRFKDTDGDDIIFKLLDGRLQQHVNGRLEIEALQSLTWNSPTREITDEKGVIELCPEESPATVGALHKLAVEASVVWQGDVPQE